MSRNMDIFVFCICFVLSWHVPEANANDIKHGSRKLSYEFNPGCNIPQCEGLKTVEMNLIHVTADGPDDCIHYLWSTWKLPSIIVAKTLHNTTLNVNWTKLYYFQSGALKFSKDPEYSMGFVAKEIWEFIDEKDKVDMSKSQDSLRSLNLSSLQWTNANETLKLINNLVTTSPKSYSNESVFSEGGSFGVKFAVSGEKAPSEDSPHLIYTANSTQFTVILNNLDPDSKKSRFAMEFVAFAPFVSESEVWKNKTEKSINDEYSPGVFSIFEMTTPCSEGLDNCSGVFSWKPVAYTGEKPIVSNSSDASRSPFDCHNISVSHSIVTSYFEGLPNVSISQISWNMTFGTSGDGFYSKTHYTSWTIMMGLGSSISEKMSKIILIVISVGLGAPTAIMIGGSIYLAFTKCRRKDDDLLLSQDSMN